MLPETDRRIARVFIQARLSSLSKRMIPRQCESSVRHTDTSVVRRLHPGRVPGRGGLRGGPSIVQVEVQG